MRVMLSVLRPVGYDPATQGTPAMRVAIDEVNDAMVAAGVRVFVGGLRPTAEAERIDASGTARAATSGDEYLDGLWVLDVASEDEAREWAKRASAACGAVIEVRPFYG